MCGHCSVVNVCVQINFDKLNAVFSELPSVEGMGKAEDLEGFLQAGSHGRSTYRLVRA